MLDRRGCLWELRAEVGDDTPASTVTPIERIMQHHPLTAVQMLALLTETWDRGETSSAIAARLGYARPTVRTYARAECGRVRGAARGPLPKWAGEGRRSGPSGGAHMGRERSRCTDRAWWGSA